MFGPVKFIDFSLLWLYSHFVICNNDLNNMYESKFWFYDNMLELICFPAVHINEFHSILLFATRLIALSRTNLPPCSFAVALLIFAPPIPKCAHMRSLSSFRFCYLEFSAFSCHSNISIHMWLLLLFLLFTQCGHIHCHIHSRANHWHNHHHWPTIIRAIKMATAAINRMMWAQQRTRKQMMLSIVAGHARISLVP